MVDRLTAMMMVVVTFVSLLVHIYTIGYMEEDPGYQRFFSYISLFTFSMLTLVMSNNFLQLFFGWEAVGLVSYLLIGFWFKRPTAVFANMKAFLVNRVGDFGFILGIAGVLLWFGSLDYSTVFANATTMAGAKVQLFAGHEWSVMTLICICLFIGAMGKSAQVPLHVWLPDSMEGPTPISALIHAATMVTAGIFMVARMSPLFELSETALNFILFIGATTAFFTGLIGIVQNDIKRVVAYSTLSQLGYMTVALGVSAYSAAVFHLMTHAFFKALLFLAAGSVIIGMHHEQDMRKMGGLRKYMKVTYWTSVIGTLALVGTPFFSGFYSKDTIIEAAAHHAHESHSWVATYGYWAVLGGVLVTSFYSFRLLFLTFHGKERFRDAHAHDAHAHHDSAHTDAEAQLHAHDAHAHDTHGHDDHGHGHHGAHEPHESKWVVTLPLILLAIPSVAIGFFTIGPMLFGTDWQGAPCSARDEGPGNFVLHRHRRFLRSRARHRGCTGRRVPWPARLRPAWHDRSTVLPDRGRPAAGGVVLPVEAGTGRQIAPGVRADSVVAGKQVRLRQAVDQWLRRWWRRPWQGVTCSRYPCGRRCGRQWFCPTDRPGCKSAASHAIRFPLSLRLRNDHRFDCLVGGTDAFLALTCTE